MKADRRIAIHFAEQRKRPMKSPALSLIGVGNGACLGDGGSYSEGGLRTGSLFGCL